VSQDESWNQPRPEQPEGHESKCPCLACEDWAWQLLYWEQQQKLKGVDPWAKWR
jgi:hypothetical protein